MTPEEEKQKIENVVKAARKLVAAWDEFDGDASCVGELLADLINAVDATGD